MKASDLPLEVKRTMLDQARQQLGHESYERLLSALGADGLLDLALPSSTPPPSSQFVQKALAVIVWSWWLWIPLLVGLLFRWLGGEEAGKTALEVCFNLVWIGYLVGNFLQWLAGLFSGRG